MKRFSIWILLLTLLQAASLTSCVFDDGQTGTTVDPDVLEISYSVRGSSEVNVTRAVTGTTEENRIEGIYTLFFEPTNNGSGLYLGCSYAGVTSSGNESSGNSRIGMPYGLNAQDAFSMIIIANMDRFVNKGSHASAGDWLDATLTSKDQQWARENLQATFTNILGMKAPLMMSTECDKSAGSNTLTNVTLTRAAGRVDVSNNSRTPFELVSAQVWNARTNAFIVDNGVPPSTGSTVKYTGNVQSASGTKIEGGLYFFENTVMTPIQNDYTTTCLMIAGKYNGSADVTYYRVNIHATGLSQDLKRNHIYTIKITDVNGPGEGDIDDAYNKNEVAMDYVINDWEDDFEGGYVTDQYGNRLSVSRRYVTFSDAANQEVQIEVFCLPGTTNPISGDWTIDSPLTGSHPDHFSAEQETGTPPRFLNVKTLYDNNDTRDRAAIVTVRWGSISVEVNLKQVNPTSQISGLRASPSNLWFPKDANGTANAKQFSLDVLGNYTDITDPQTQIETAIVWTSGGPGWFTLEYESYQGAGIYRYIVTPTTMPDGGSSSYRDATIKLSLNVGGTALSAAVYVKQSNIDSDYEASLRQLQVEAWRAADTTYDTYNNLGSMTTAFTTFKGFPADQQTDRDLHFALNEKRELKYRVKLTSTMSWKIIPKGTAAARLDFSMTSFDGDGSEQMHEIWVTANLDIVNDASHASNGRWDASFDLEYENGDIETFLCHQTGMLAVLPTDSQTYYYGTVFMNGRYWLDRNLGATSNGFYNALTDDGDPEALGTSLTRAQAVASCPAGFRLPKTASDRVDEWDWVYAFAQYAADDHEEHPQSWYIEYSSSPVMNWWLPMYNRVGLGATAYFGYDDTTGFVVNGAHSYGTAGSITASSTRWHNAIMPTSGSKYLGSIIVYGGVSKNGSGSWGSWIKYLENGIATTNYYRHYWYNATSPAYAGGTTTGLLLARCIREDGTEVTP